MESINKIRPHNLRNHSEILLCFIFTVDMVFIVDVKRQSFCFWIVSDIQFSFWWFLDKLTANKQIPTMIMPTIEASHRPILCPKGPKRFVPSRYAMLAGRKAEPVCHADALTVSRSHIGKDGSSIAIPILANMIDPAAIKM